MRTNFFARHTQDLKNIAGLCLTLCVLLALPAMAHAVEIKLPKFIKEEPQVVKPLLPDAAVTIAKQLDEQLVERLNLLEGPAKGYALIVTTPVNLNNLEESTPLARQMGEELSGWFVQSGYKVQEIRKGRTVLFAPKQGELLLTRRTKLLGAENVRSSIILTSTYTTSIRHIRFNVRLIHAATNEVLAMSSHTIPLNGELRLLAQNEGMRGVRNIGIAPSIRTRLP